MVGETGSGKSTLARAILQAPRPKSGSVMFRGTELTRLRGRNLLQARRHMQMVFQDPFGSLDPKWQVRVIVEEPLIAYRIGSRASAGARVNELLDLVGLDPARYAKRRPPRAVGRSGAARRDRPGARARPRADHLRRGRVLARRADPGAGAEPLRAAARRARPVLPVHRARPGAGQAGQRPGGGDVPRQAVRGRAGRGGVPRAAAPVHQGTARLDPVHRAVAPGGPARRSRASRRRRSTRRAGAGSAPAARGRQTSARSRSRCRGRWPPATWWPATTR